MVDLIRVELAVGVHVVRVLVERRMVQVGAGHRQSLGRVRQVGEHHRGGQHVHRVVLPVEAWVEQAGDDVGALEVQVIPHALAQQRIRVLRALEIRGVAEEPCQNRTDHRAQTQFQDRVLLVGVVDAHLRGRRTAHHARAELADASQIRGHRLVPVLRIDRNVGVAGFRLVAVVHQAEAKFVEDRIRLAAEPAVDAGKVLGLAQDADRGLHLAARLQRNGDAVARQADQLAVLPIFLVFVVVRADAIQQRADAVLLVVVHGGVVAVVYRQMLYLHAEAARAAALATGFKKFDQALHVLWIRLGQQMRIRNLRRCHARHRNGKPSAQRRRRYTENR